MMPLHYDDVESDLTERVDAVHRLLRSRHWTIATAESMTGGLLAGALISVPGASAVVKGGLVAYSDQLKTSLLGIDQALLDEQGPVTAAVAEQMALGASELLGADVVVSTTGAAGPEYLAGTKPGSSYVAVKLPGVEVAVRAVRLKGDRQQVRVRTVARALELVEASLRQAV
ncbi:MAG: CinA family protein [Bifidobacteriaceae bacterium]|jgi:nicotinamide-nucleotide amidase|nr:CinA family protein [Bifidobacteriaceae bacterium]